MDTKKINIRETGYRPRGTLDTSNPPKCGSGIVYPKQTPPQTPPQIPIEIRIKIDLGSAD